jgi:hypothetical protein
MLIWRQSSQFLSHTSGLAHIENEEIMGYYQAIGDPRGTLLMRYFAAEDEAAREKALPEVQNVMTTLVISTILFVLHDPFVILIS